MNVNTVNAILDAIQDDMKKVYQIVTDSGHVFYLNGLTSQNTPRFQVTIDRDQGIFNLNDTKDTRYGDTVIEFANISTFNFFEEASTLIGAITGADGTKSGGSGSGTATPYTAATLPDPATLAPGATVVLTGTFAADVTSVLLTVDYVKGVKSWTGTVISANDPVDADGLPNGVTWVKV